MSTSQVKAWPIVAVSLACLLSWTLGGALAVERVDSGVGGRPNGLPTPEPAPQRAASVAAPPIASAPVAAAGAAGTGAPAAPAEHDLGPPRPTFHGRDPRQWQGMLVDTSELQAFCDRSSDCGLALACLGPGRGCGPCTDDAQCEPSERCVLDHCVLDAHVKCRSRVDCAGDAQCMLSGLSPGPRGNVEMRTLCTSELVHRPEAPVIPTAAAPEQAPVRSGTPYQALRQRLAEATP